MTTVGRTGLRRALDAANVPCLTMCLVQLTGDLRWLEPPYAPTRARGLDDHDTGGLPDEVQDEIRDALAEVLEAGAPPALPAPRGELLLRMLRTFTGEPVGDEFEPMMAETLGVAEPEPTPRPDVPAGTDALVVGAGVGGLLAVATLRAMGIGVTALESNDEVGRHLVGEPLPRRRRRHPQPPVLLLVPPAPLVDRASGVATRCSTTCATSPTTPTCAATSSSAPTSSRRPGTTTAAAGTSSSAGPTAPARPAAPPC